MDSVGGVSGASRFARRIGAVTAAAAALLATSAAHSNESDLMRGLIDRVVVTSLDINRDNILPPLILTPSNPQIDSLYAGHRSHSSHSSHRSHSSHASSSMGGGRTTQSSPSFDRVTPAATPLRPNKPATGAASKLSQGDSLESRNVSNSDQTVPEKAAPQKYEPPAGVNLGNPTERFQLINVPQVDEEARANIKDLATGKSTLFDLGEKVGEFTLVEIDLRTESVRLRGTGTKDITLTKIRKGK